MMAPDRRVLELHAVLLFLDMLYIVYIKSDYILYL